VVRHRPLRGIRLRRAGELGFRLQADAPGGMSRYGRRMTRRLNALVRDPRAQRAGDVLLAAVLTVAALVDLFTGAIVSWGGRGPGQLVAAVLSTLPLVWRVRQPVLVALTISTASGVLVILAAPHQASFEPFVAIIVAAYSLGAHAPGRRGVQGLGLMFATGLPLSIVASTRGEKGGDLIPAIVWIIGAWTIGRIILGRRLRTIELEVLTSELEGQRELQAQAAVAVERARIARELHDVIAHNVSMIVVQAGAAARVLEGDHRDVRAALAAIEGTGRETVDEMRRLIGIVRSDDGLALAPQPTLADVERLVANVREAGLPVELRVEGLPVPLPPGIDLSAYRIVQEALSNAARYAPGSSVRVRIRYDEEQLLVSVIDDGASGTVVSEPGGGHGLIGMRERVTMLGGSLSTGPAEGVGFAVEAELPYAD
jgi:signal transduction histidine kinase